MLESPIQTMLVHTVGIVSSDFVITQFSIFTLRVDSSEGVNSDKIAFTTMRNVAKWVIWN